MTRPNEPSLEPPTERDDEYLCDSCGQIDSDGYKIDDDSECLVCLKCGQEVHISSPEQQDEDDGMRRADEKMDDVFDD